MWRDAYRRDLATRSWSAPVWGVTPQVDQDLAAHITVLRARGVVLLGEPVDVVFPPVPEADYRAAIAGDLLESLEGIADDPVYAVLNCCRTCAYLETGRVFSKAEGGAWGLRSLAGAGRKVAAAALEAYRTGTKPDLSAPALAAFAGEMRKRLRNL
jgi:streptomycin 3"-adenylyltransferase